jgi:hypothetical protein
LVERVASFPTVGLSESIARQFAQKALPLHHDRQEMAPVRAPSSCLESAGQRTPATTFGPSPTA